MNMKLFLIALVLMGCSSVPKKTILISSIPEEENWYSIWNDVKDHVEISTIRKGAIISLKWFDIHIGKIGYGIAYNEQKGIRYSSPTKKIWGVRFIKRFKELFIL